MSLEIKHQVSTTGGRYFAVIEGAEAELTYSRMDGSVNIIADHTGVPLPLRGTGIGRRLVEHMIEDARIKSFKIVPLCPFVKFLYRENQDWSEVIL